MEVGPQSLPFLDTRIDLNGKGYESSVYRKPSYTGLLLNFHAFSPLSWKKGLIRCFLNRAYLVSSNRNFFDLEVSNLARIFKANSYPVRIFESQVKKFFQSLSLSARRSSDDNISNDRKDTITLVLPYLGQVSESFKHKFRSFSRRYKLDTQVVFKPFKVSTYFSLKSRCPPLLRSKVIYQYTCPADQGISYIGKTSRHLTKRIKEHVRPTATQHSAVSDHILNCDCKSSHESFRILYACNSDYDLSIAEALLIQKFQPSLNLTLSGGGQSLFLKL